MSGAWAAAFAAGALWLAAGDNRTVAARRLRRMRGADRSSVRHRRALTPSRWSVAFATATAGLIAAVVVGPGAAVPAAAICGEGIYRWRRTTRDRQAAALRSAVPEVCAALAAELHAGRPAVDALAVVVGSGPHCTRDLLTPVVAAARLGGDPTPGLRGAADRPGGAGLAHLAACWSVTDVGVGLARAVSELATSLRRDVVHRAELQAQLAAVRATAGLLGTLPVVGLLLGVALGASPVSFLLHTPIGIACGASAALLDVIGLRWTDHIARRAALGR